MNLSFALLGKLKDKHKRDEHKRDKSVAEQFLLNNFSLHTYFQYRVYDQFAPLCANAMLTFRLLFQNTSPAPC